MVAALGIAIVGCSSSQSTGPGSGAATGPAAAKSPDMQVADLILQYQALSDDEQRGEIGKKLIADLSAVKGDLSEKAREAAARHVSAHNLRQLADTLHKNGDGVDGKGPFPKLPIDPNNLKFPDRKSPIDPTKFPDLKFPIDPTKFPELKFPIDPTKIPELKFPIDPTKIPDLKLPIDPTKFPDPKNFKLPAPPSIPELKFPDLPKIPELIDPVLPPPRESPR